MVDAVDSKSTAFGCASSSLASGTNFFLRVDGSDHPRRCPKKSNVLSTLIPAQMIRADSHEGLRISLQLVRIPIIDRSQKTVKLRFDKVSPLFF